MRSQKRFNRCTQKPPELLRKVARQHEAKPGARGAHLEVVHTVGPEHAPARNDSGTLSPGLRTQDDGSCAVSEQDASDDIRRRGRVSLEAERAELNAQDERIPRRGVTKQLRRQPYCSDT